MEGTVRSFNRLSRSTTTPTGLANHWVFGVRHVPLNPPGDLVVAVHPVSGFVLQAGPAQILSKASAPEQAQALTPLLLKAFTTGSASPGGRQPTDHKPFAPWTWATEDPELARAVEAHLRRAGVKHELCSVGVCCEEDSAFLEEKWIDFYHTLVRSMGLPTEPPSSARPGDASRCHGCGLRSDGVSRPFMKCSACGKAFYHSKDCQRQHWKLHKPTCLENRPANAASASPVPPARAARPIVDALTYFNTTARENPDAQALMRALHLGVRAPGDALELLGKPLLALVYTGHDTPENMQKLFGPDWREDIGEEHQKTRCQVLLAPPPGSPSYAVHLATLPGPLLLQRSPRPATEAEQQQIRKVGELQTLFSAVA